MKYGSTLFLFILSLVTAGIYFLYIQPMAEEKKIMEDFEKRFFRAETSDIEFIKLDAGRGPVTIVQKESVWRITEPAQYRPDTGVIKKIFRTLSDGRLIKVVGDKDEMERFGFDRTWVVLALGYKGSIDVLRIAGENPSSTGNYAYAERLGKIFLVNKELAVNLNLKPYDLREKRFFLFEPEALGRIRIRKREEMVELVREDGAWRMISPEVWPGSSDDIKGLIDVLHTQKASAFSPWEEELGNLPEHLSVELFDTADKSIGNYDVYFWGTEWNKGTLIHNPGSKEAARTRREFWTLLNGDHTRFMYRNLFIIYPETILNLSLLSGHDRYLIENRDNIWLLNGRPVAGEKIMKLMNILNSWKAVKLVKEDRSPGREQFKIEVTTSEGTKKVVVSDFNMDHEISGSKMFIPKEPGGPETKKIDYWYSRATDLKSGAVVSSIDIEEIINEVKNLHE